MSLRIRASKENEMSRQPSENELFDYMEGSLPPEKHAAVKKYLDEHEDCRVSLEAAQNGAKALGAFKVSGSVDFVSDIMQKINQPALPSTPYLKYGLLASILIIFIATSIAFLSKSEPQPQVVPVPKPDVQQFVPPAEPPKVIAQQPDAIVKPVVILNSESIQLAANEQRTVESEKTGTILFAGPGDFVVTENNVKIIHGHALFKIVPRSGRNPFTVSTEDATIEVIGTVFGVNKDSKGTNVTLLKGKLRIKQMDASQTLESTFSALISEKNISIAKTTDNEIAFWSAFPASPHESDSAKPKIATDTTLPQTSLEQPTTNNEHSNTDSSEIRSPLELLNDWSIKQPDSGH
ncbi:MAG: FecR family protein [Candidatus Riflebacteria bacterium]|nr:FecR family protein [Candidatus Riflebacteria bacterium]